MSASTQSPSLDEEPHPTHTPASRPLVLAQLVPRTAARSKPAAVARAEAGADRVRSTRPPSCSRSSCSRRVSRACTCGGQGSHSGVSARQIAREDFKPKYADEKPAVEDAVIVPAGAKGGFVGEHPAVRDAAQLPRRGRGVPFFIGALLNVTDNIVNGQVVPARQVVFPVRRRRSVLFVVAADKGAASFSDVQTVALAAASGSVKRSRRAARGLTAEAMGITARGAWESVRRHFQHLQMMPTSTASPSSASATCRRHLRQRDVVSEHHQARRHVRPPPRVPRLPTPTRQNHFINAAACSAARSSWARLSASLPLFRGSGVFARSLKSITIDRRSAPARRRRRRGRARPASSSRSSCRRPSTCFTDQQLHRHVREGEHRDRARSATRRTTIASTATNCDCRSIEDEGDLGFTQRSRFEYLAGPGTSIPTTIDDDGRRRLQHSDVEVVLDGGPRRRVGQHQSTRSCWWHDRRGRRARAARRPPEPRPRQRQRPRPR